MWQYTMTKDTWFKGSFIIILNELIWMLLFLWLFWLNGALCLKQRKLDLYRRLRISSKESFICLVGWRVMYKHLSCIDSNRKKHQSVPMKINDLVNIIYHWYVNIELLIFANIKYVSLIWIQWSAVVDHDWSN